MARGKLLGSSWLSLRVLSRSPCAFLVGRHEWLSGLAVTGVENFGMQPARGWLWFAQGISDFSYYDKVLRKLEGVSASSHLAAASILSH